LAYSLDKGNTGAAAALKRVQAAINKCAKAKREQINPDVGMSLDFV